MFCPSYPFYPCCPFNLNFLKMIGIPGRTSCCWTSRRSLTVEIWSARGAGSRIEPLDVTMAALKTNYSDQLDLCCLLSIFILVDFLFIIGTMLYYKLQLVTVISTAYSGSSLNPGTGSGSFRLLVALHSYKLVYFTFTGSPGASYSISCIDSRASAMCDVLINSVTDMYFTCFSPVPHYS